MTSKRRLARNARRPAPGAPGGPSPPTGLPVTPASWLAAARPARRLDLVARRLGHLAAQPDGGRGDGAEAEQEPPGQRRRRPAAEQGEGDQRADDQADRLGGEDQPDQPAAVVVAGVLAHQHGADRVVTADAEAEQEPEHDQHARTGTAPSRPRRRP